MFTSDQLLAPIRADQPCGDDLSFSAEFDAIAEARRFDDRSIDQGEWQTECKDADWGQVVERCSELLTHRSKDLRLAVWLAEAGAMRHGMRGLAEGLRVLAGLFGQYWELGLYPAAPDGDHEQRIDNLAWVLARVPVLLGDMAVTTGPGRRYCLADVDAAARNPEAPELKLADLKAALAANPEAFSAQCAADAQCCLEVLAQLEAAAAARLGANRPGFSAAREKLAAMLRLMGPAGGSGEAAEPAAPVPAAQGRPGVVGSRGEAIAQLRAVAAFFRASEPHSPVSYYADKAADAGEQSLHDWLRSVVKDPGSLAHIEELLGVPPEKP